MRDAHGAWILFAIAPAAACGYRAGTFAFGTSAAGACATYGCIDVSVSRRADHVGGPVLAYELGNGCDHAVVVDLAAIPVVVRDGELRPYDPNRELRSLALDGRTIGAEAIEYRAAAAIDDDVVCAQPGAALGYADRAWTCLTRASQVVSP